MNTEHLFGLFLARQRFLRARPPDEGTGAAAATVPDAAARREADRDAALERLFHAVRQATLESRDRR